MTFMTPTDVASGDAAGVVTATAALKRSEKALLRLALGDLVKRRKILVASGRRNWLESFQWHDNRNVKMLRLEQRFIRLDKVKRFTFLEADNRFLPVIRATGIGATLTAEFSVIVGSANGQNGFSEELFNSLLDFKLVGLAIDFEGDFVVSLLEKGGLLAESDVFNDLVNVFHDLDDRSGVQAVRAASV
jgi:hypothetical protein